MSANDDPSASDDRNTPVGRGFSPGETDIDRALESLTDAAPSPDLRARIMSRVALEPRARSTHQLRARLALAAVIVTAAAVSAWFLSRPVPTSRLAGNAKPSEVGSEPTVPGHSTGTITRQQDEAAGRIAEIAPGRIASVQRHRGTWRRRPAGAYGAASPGNTAALEPGDTVAPAIVPIDVLPILEPEPVTMTPMTVTRIEIPEIEIRPVDEPPGSAGQPAKGDPDKKPASDLRTRGPSDHH